MRYSPILVQPTREGLTRFGFEELKTPEAVDADMLERSDIEGHGADEVAASLTTAFTGHCGS